MQDKILQELKQADDYISGQRLCEKYGVSRSAVWKAINSLRKKGYKINSATNRGYRLEFSADIISVNEVKGYLHTQLIGKDIYVLESVDSTNDYLKALGANGAKNGVCVFAREQTAGKGRLGRQWSSNKDLGVWMSVLMRPNITPAEVCAITPMAGYAVCKALREVCDINCNIKWPNDIVIGNKKICGILTEMSAETDKVNYVVTGIGINTDNEAFPPEIAEKATSILLETNKMFEKSLIAARVLDNLEDIIRKTEFEFTKDFLKAYKEMCISLNREVGFSRKGQLYKGTAIDISEKGGLIVKTLDDEIYEVTTGEVTVSGIY